MPAGTIVPARGFVVVRGINAPAVPANLLLANGGRTVEVIVNTGNSVCIGGGFRLWFPDSGGVVCLLRQGWSTTGCNILE